MGSEIIGDFGIVEVSELKGSRYKIRRSKDSVGESDLKGRK